MRGSSRVGEEVRPPGPAPETRRASYEYEYGFSPCKDSSYGNRLILVDYVPPVLATRGFKVIHTKNPGLVMYVSCRAHFVALRVMQA